MQIIAGIFKNRKLQTPKGLQTRPTASRLRESLFNIVQSYIEDSRFLDLFAGSGAMGLEALSRGAKEATFIDHHKDSIQMINHNIKLLEVEAQARVIMGNVFQLLDRLNKKGDRFDIIFADPPYNTYIKSAFGDLSYGETIIKVIDENDLLVPDGDLFIEDGHEARFINDLKTLKLVSLRKSGKAFLHQLRKTK